MKVSVKKFDHLKNDYETARNSVLSEVVEYLTDANTSIKNVASHLGLHYKVVWNIKSGANKTPLHDTLKAIVAYARLKK